MRREFPVGLVVRILVFTAMAQVQSLVGELRSRKLQGVAKKKKKRSPECERGQMFKMEIWVASKS